jgi:hypothetical protein
MYQFSITGRVNYISLESSSDSNKREISVQVKDIQ